MLNFIQSWMVHYGYYVLGISLMLELLALPLPGEVIMTYAGLLIYQGNLNWFLSILAAGAGASIGMTSSYWIGYKLGNPFFEKYGSKIHIGPERLMKTSKWFERYGYKVLIIAYFIPGVRHFTGYFSGITRMPFQTYMLYAYSGAFIWTATFISLGKILGPKWEQFHRIITKYLLIAGIIAAVIMIVVYLYHKYRCQLYEVTLLTLNKGVKTFHTLGRVKLLVVVSIGTFLMFFILMLGLVQDFLANEFAEFDAVTSYLVPAIFDKSWAVWLNRISYLTTIPVLLMLVALSLFWIVSKGKDRMLEIGFLLFVFGGVWLSFNIVLLETFRFFRNNKKNFSI